MKVLLILTVTLLGAGATEAARNDMRTRETWYTCAGHYTKVKRNVRFDEKSGAMICLDPAERGRRGLTLGEANIACRDQFQKLSRLIAKTPHGWQCSIRQ
jgi:hypothetical protein